MTIDNDAQRLIAWSSELRLVHTRLRTALAVTLQAAESGDHAGAASRDLMLFCHGFCVALTDHHEGEDAHLFPAIAAAHPELSDTLQRLQQDHAMIGTLLTGLRNATESGTAHQLAGHLHGIAAIVESHFRYEERALLEVLDRLALDADPRVVLGPL